MFSIESQFSCWDHCLSIEQPEQHKVTTELHRIIRFKGLSNFWGMQIYVNPSKPKHNVLEKRFEDWKGLKNERIWKINYMLRKKPQEYQTLDAKLTKQQNDESLISLAFGKRISGVNIIYIPLLNISWSLIRIVCSGSPCLRISFTISITINPPFLIYIEKHISICIKT